MSPFQTASGQYNPPSEVAMAGMANRVDGSWRAWLAAAGLMAAISGGSLAGQQPPPERAPARPQQAGFDVARLAQVDAVVGEAIAAKKMPGAVVLVGHRGSVVYRKAFGNRAVEPAAEAMTVDTIFDAASLTKVVATTSAVMVLVESGRLRLTDRVSVFVPGFERYGKDGITVRHLLTHTSGLRPDVDWSFPWVGYDKAIELAVEEVPQAIPDERVIYSDINFFLRGHIVARVCGMPLEQFVREKVFLPLGMRDTMFLPPESLRARIAPTERCTQFGWPCDGPDAVILRGIVHDPTARRMGGVAGHAGLFTTADDLARFARMLLGGGMLDGVRVLSPLAVARMTEQATPPGERNVRGLGWDIDSSYSVNRGELFPRGSFGHTGWTGTSLWIDPATETFVVFLSNRVHPDGKGDVTPVRARVATVVASAITAAPRRSGPPFGGFALAPAPGPAAGPDTPRAPVLSGIDVLRAEGFARLRGKRVGLLTNHTGRARDGATTIDLLFQAKDVKLVKLFSPEHGIRGILDENVPSSTDEKTGLPIHSLYGATRRPTPEMLEGIDAIVIDLQDIGVRFYTYLTATAYVMEECAKRKLPVVVLDRPNPVNGWQIEGPALDKDLASYVGYFPAMPIRHGMTIGEVARLFNGENGIGADLTVVEMKGWTRDAWFDETGQPWVNPSPNMRNLVAATVYPGIGAIEYSNISVGRGTDTPFEQIGAPWIDGVALAEALNARRLPGIRFYPVSFTPVSSKYEGQLCHGVFMVVTDRQALRPARVGLEVASALVRLHGGTFDLANTEKLVGSRESLAQLQRGDSPERIVAGWAPDEARWRLLRAKYLLYR
jgi:uncharacterized protein YbbC (DUF1343 family)/CubicO group peptidase (beta-lactamase class C family)